MTVVLSPSSQNNPIKPPANSSQQPYALETAIRVNPREAE